MCKLYKNVLYAMYNMKDAKNNMSNYVCYNIMKRKIYNLCKNLNPYVIIIINEYCKNNKNNKLYKKRYKLYKNNKLYKFV